MKSVDAANRSRNEGGLRVGCLEEQEKAIEFSQRQLRKKNQTLKHDAAPRWRFVTKWEAENERFYDDVRAFSTERSETALGARMAHKMVDALKNIVALLKNA